jgi:sterol 3beta-glucosyltransferase
LRAIFTNFGTRGDFQPLCALARYAKDQGHVPVFAIPAFAAEMIEQFGFEFILISGDLSELRDEINRNWILEQDSYVDPEKLWKLLSPFQHYFALSFEELLKTCRSADVLISGPAQPLGRIVHDYSGIPFVSAQFTHFGGTGGPGLEKAGELLVNPFRRQLGLAETRHPFTTGANSPQLALYAMSPFLYPRHRDWPSHYHLTGFWFAPSRPEINAELKGFIEMGRPPVVVTFGSMTNVVDTDLTELVAEACRLSCTRAVIQGPGWLGQVNDCVFVAGYVPHEWLFAQAACVVLHGGAGTAAAVFRAGVPGVFVPHIHDQAYWAQIAHDMGCAVEPIAFSDLTAEKLAAGIQQSLANESIRIQAAELGRRIRKENGVCKAWKMIDDLVKRVGLCD